MQRNGFGLGTAGALGLGAGLMFILDPKRGKTRRARIRDKTVKAVHGLEDAARGRTLDAAHRAAGAVAEVRAALRPERVDDDVIGERVRSKLGRMVAHPHELETRVENGCVVLSGRVSTGELPEVLARVRLVRGVRGLENRLETYEGPPVPVAARRLRSWLGWAFLGGLALAFMRPR
jgi:hyperosmotically inducible periplasmic protein